MNSEQKIGVGLITIGLVLMAYGFYDISEPGFNLPVASAAPVLGGIVLTVAAVYASLRARG